MNYIDPAKYSELLKNFAQGAKKQTLQEGYVDLAPINIVNEVKPTDMSHIYAKYPDSMEEAETIKNPGKYAGGPRAAFDKDGDGVPDGADKNPADGSKQEEGIHLDKPTGPTITTVEGKRDFKRLSPDERKQLEEYIKSKKTIETEIKKLLEKATVVEGGDTTGKVLGADSDDAEVEDMIAKHEKEKEGEEAVAGQWDL